MIHQMNSAALSPHFKLEAALRPPVAAPPTTFGCPAVCPPPWPPPPWPPIPFFPDKVALTESCCTATPCVCAYSLPVLYKQCPSGPLPPAQDRSVGFGALGPAKAEGPRERRMQIMVVVGGRILKIDGLVACNSHGGYFVI